MTIPHNVDIYIDGLNGDDANPGTKEAPVKTRTRAWALLPSMYSGYCNVHGTRAEDFQPTPEELEEIRKEMAAREPITCPRCIRFYGYEPTATEQPLCEDCASGDFTEDD